MSSPAGFYANQTGEAIVAALQQRGGVLAAEDLAAHRTAFVDPISTTYRGHRVYEVPPPTQVH
jgi:gamma-glutamyltranspeptidase